MSGLREIAGVKRCAALLTIVAAAALAASGSAGNYLPPPGDCCPQWSPHGTQIVFAGSRGQGADVGAVAATGGPDRLVIHGGGGGDTVYAVDGRRDRISCGENGYDRRDRVYADRIDLVAPDCELVHRR